MVIIKRVVLITIVLLLLISRSDAQVVPVTKTLAWDAGTNADSYQVSLDGVSIGITTSLSIPFTITTTGSHTFTIVSSNMWGTSSPPPATLTINVVSPGKSGNLRIQ